MARRCIEFVIFVAFSVATMSCSKEAAETPNPEMPAVVQGNTAFALDLYSRLAAEGPGNLFFSPSSISTALAMTCGGAKGQTAHEMAKTLHFSQDQARLHATFAELLKKLDGKDKKKGYQLNIVNALWGQK